NRSAPRPCRPLRVRSEKPSGQYREFHRRGAGADRARRAAAHQRRARARRILHSDGDHRGDAGRQLQSRHAPHHRVRRRQGDGGRAVDAALAGFPVRGRPRGARIRRVGRRAFRGDQGAAAETTTRSGKLVSIQQFAVGPTRHLRFNFTTGDAAGQNMSGKATAAACEWIRANRPGGARYILSGNTDTDKKHSQMNMLATRGRRVVAEAVLGKEALKRMMRVDPRDLFYARQVSQAGAFLAGSANNGAHAANGLAAMFIATGQDAANVAESHAAIVYAQLLEDGDYYWSITLPALIVATVGGGTGLATQSECLAMLGCQGSGKADKLAEICAAVALAGDISLSCAILSGDWVS